MDADTEHMGNGINRSSTAKRNYSLRSYMVGGYEPSIFDRMSVSSIELQWMDEIGARADKSPTCSWHHYFPHANEWPSVGLDDGATS
jgi:hypothetical protein